MVTRSLKLLCLIPVVSGLIVPRAAAQLPHLVQLNLVDRDSMPLNLREVRGIVRVSRAQGDTLIRYSGSNGAWVINCDDFNTVYGSGHWMPGDTLDIHFKQIAGDHTGDSYIIELITPFMDSQYPMIQHSRLKLPVESKSRSGTPESYLLVQNYPNPFNGETRVQFSLPREEHVQLNVFNVLGVLVRRLRDQKEAAGSVLINWDGCDDGGAPLPTGIYYLQLAAGRFKSARKMVLVR